MIAVANRDFLRAVFGPAWRDALTVGFRGAPEQRGQLGFPARRAGNFVPNDLGANNYFCISTCHPGEGGRAQRKKELHKAMHIVVLDDVGEKLRPDAIRAAWGEPTYRLRTSPNSQQWGYRLETPETSAARVDALLGAVIGSKNINPGGTDPGMAGVTRLVRLPVGRNGKA